MARTTAQPPEPPPMESAWRSVAEVSEGGSFVPSDGVSARGGVPVTTIEPRAAFQLVHLPKRWTVMDGKVIPLLDKMVFTTGVNAVDANQRTGAPMVGGARAERETHGQILIPFDAIPKAHRGRADLHQTPDGQPSYLWRPKGRPDVTLLIYEQAHPGDDVVTTNRAAYIEFCDHLVSSGIIPAVPIYTLRRMLSTESARLLTILDRAKSTPSYAIQAEAKQKMIAAIESAIAERTEAEARRPGGRMVSSGETFLPEGA